MSLASPASRLIALLLVAAGCSGDPESAPGRQNEWRQVFGELPGALISLWGSSASDVWAVGGDPGDGNGPMVLRFDGDGWTRLRAPVEGALWWVHGFAGGPVFIGGEGGNILRYEDGGFEVMSTPGSGTVFGIWGVSQDDLFAVGGAGTTPAGGFVWRFDGESWREDETAPSDLAATATLFKVWGRAADDVWLVGTQGLALHYDGSGYEEVGSATTRTLFTVHGDDATTIAVGGYGSGVLVESEGGEFSDVTPADAPQMTGVFARGEVAYAAGVRGAVMRREEGAWAVEETGLDLGDDFHAVWVDPDGGVWAVGGQVASFPLVRGMMVYRGDARVGEGEYAAER